MYKINKYPDGSSYVDTFAQGTETVKINSYEDLWHLRQLVDAKNSIGIPPVINIPNLIDAQADRRFETSQSSGVKLVLDFLNSLDATYRIFHPHNPEVVEAVLGNKVTIVDNSGFINEVLSALGVYYMNSNTLVLMSTDAGGFKPLMKTCDIIDWSGEVYSASKSRSYKDGKSKLYQVVDREDFGGKDVLVVDDICVGGGTFIGLAKLLRERNVGKIYLAVSHIAIPDLKKELIDSFDKIFTTNSKYDAYFTEGKDCWVKSDNLMVFPLFKTTEYV
jgi:ribose-phosphate pyrophosphokinase